MFENIVVNILYFIKELFVILSKDITATATLMLAFLTLCMVREMKKNREQDRRPYLYFYFSDEGDFLYLTLKNSGKNGAYDITTKFNPEIKNSRIDGFYLCNPENKTLLPQEKKKIIECEENKIGFLKEESRECIYEYKDMITNKTYKDKIDLKSL